MSSDNPIPSIGKPTQKFDYHYAYKQRSKMSTRKLESFFGEKPPLDICMKEIEKEGLKAMLNSKIPLCYFMYSLLEEYSAENLVSKQKRVISKGYIEGLYRRVISKGYIEGLYRRVILKGLY